MNYKNKQMRKNKNNFIGGDYSNKFTKNANEMRTMIGDDSDMSFSGGDYSDKFPKAGAVNEQAGFAKSSFSGKKGDILNSDVSYFTEESFNSFNPRSVTSSSTSKRGSSDRISQQPVKGVDKKKKPSAKSSAAAAARTKTLNYNGKSSCGSNSSNHSNFSKNRR